jgi:hypothetical protein
MNSTGEVPIRVAAPADAARITALFTRLGYETSAADTAARLSADPDLAVVALCDGIVVGGGGPARPVILPAFSAI